MKQGTVRGRWSLGVMMAAVVLGGAAASCGGGDEGAAADGGTPTDAGTPPPPPPNEEGRSLAVSPAGVVVVGSTEANLATTGVDLLVRRYTPEGAVDTAFGTQGSVVLDFGGPALGPLSGESERDDRADTVAILPDGRILVAGFCKALRHADSRDLAIVRLKPTGQLDPTFNSAGSTPGVRSAHVGPTDGFDFPASVHSLLPLADGRFYVGGLITKASNPYDEDFALLRYTADGALDTSFTSSGNQPGSWFGRAYEYLQSVQGMVLQGTSVVLAGGEDFAAVRILTSGAQDMTFGTSGLASSKGGRAHALAVRPGGGLLLAGERQDVQVGGKKFGVLKLVAYTQNGKLDSGFGTAGVRELTAPEDALDVVDVSGLQVLADGRILVYADVRAQPALLRLLATGELDPSFGTGGIVRWPESRLSPPLFIRPTSGPKLAVSGSRAFVTDANSYSDAIIPSGIRRVLLRDTGL